MTSFRSRAATKRLLASVSGLIAGAMSMAAGDFVSVHSQEYAENGDLAQERAELKQDPAGAV